MRCHSFPETLTGWLHPRGNASFRPQRSHRSSLVFSHVTTQFARTWVEGVLNRGVQGSEVGVVSTRRHRYTTALCPRTTYHVALNILDDSRFSRAFKQLDSPVPLTVGVEAAKTGWSSPWHYFFTDLPRTSDQGRGQCTALHSWTAAVGSKEPSGS